MPWRLNTRTVRPVLHCVSPVFEEATRPVAARPRMLRGLFLLIATLSLVLGGGRAMAQLTGFQATLDRNTISIGEQAALSVTCNNFTVPTPPQLPPIPNSQVQYVGKGSSVTILNGQVNQQTTYTYVVVPQNIGNIVIPPITVDANGRKLSTQPLMLQVVPAGQGPLGGGNPATPNQPKPAFLRLTTSRTNVFLGEIMQAEIRLYYLDGRLHQLPQLGGEGFTLGKVIQNGQGAEAVDGINYTVFSFVCTAIPNKAGDLALGPATMEFGLFGRPAGVFGTVAFQRVTLRSDSTPVTVRPLPTDGRPAEYNGAVGTFAINATASPTNVLAGDPITLRIEISGRGNVDMARLGEQKGLRDFQTYPPNSVIETDPLGQQGRVRTEWVVAPQNAAITEIPPLVFNFFDPVSGSFKSATTRPIPITVRATGTTRIGSDPKKLDTGPKPVEIAHIRPTLGVVAAPSVPLVTQPWFWAVQSIAPLIWIIAFAIRKKREASARNVDARRKKDVSRKVRDGLAEMAVLARADNVEGFFALGFRLLQEQLGERLKITASGITESVVEENLRSRGLPEEFLASCHELFGACNNVRYAPHQTTEQLQGWIPKFESVFVELQKLK